MNIIDPSLGLSGPQTEPPIPSAGPLAGCEAVDWVANPPRDLIIDHVIHGSGIRGRSTREAAVVSGADGDLTESYGAAIGAATGQNRVWDVHPSPGVQGSFLGGASQAAVSPVSELNRSSSSPVPSGREAPDSWRDVRGASSPAPCPQGGSRPQHHPAPRAGAHGGGGVNSAMRRVQQLTDEMMMVSEEEKLVLGRAIGQGAYGTVFLGRWRNLDVAVKVGGRTIRKRYVVRQNLAISSFGGRL